MNIEIEIIKDGKVVAVEVIQESEWVDYNFVDYIEVDNDHYNHVSELFLVAHGPMAYEAMQFLVDCSDIS